MLDARDIAHNRIQWVAVDRQRALAACHRETVMVVHRTRGREAAEPLTPHSPFYRGSGSFNYRQLRYYLRADGAAAQALAPEAVAPRRTPSSQENPDSDSALERLFPEEEEKKAPFPVTFSLRRKNGKPFPPTPFEVTLPDGKIRSGVSGADGFIRVLDNAAPGQATLKLLPEKTAKTLQPFAQPKPRKHPLDFTLQDDEGNPLADKAYELVFENGTRLSGVSGADGKILHPDNELEGRVRLILAPSPVVPTGTETPVQQEAQNG